MTLKPGDPAPDIRLPSSDGKEFRLSDFRDRNNVVIYFYPKDSAPGCTTQACGIRDNYKEILKRDAVIAGISADDLKSHDKFLRKHDLPFPLLADTDQKVCQVYGVWVEKNMYGKKFWGVARTTFVIGKDGRILEVLRKVGPKDHAEDLIQVLKRFS